MQIRTNPIPLRLIQLPISPPQAQEQRYFATLLKLKISLQYAAPHLDHQMLYAFQQRLLPVTCRHWMKIY